jgi:hypothetical protein
MSYNNKPITAKIKKTTKGGMISQPVLNMGAPVKMKASSPAKKSPGASRNISFKEYRESGKMDPKEAKFYKGSGSKKVSADDFPKTKAPSSGSKDTSAQQKRLKAENKSMTSTLNAYKAKGGTVNPSDAAYLKKNKNKLEKLQSSGSSKKPKKVINASEVTNKYMKDPAGIEKYKPKNKKEIEEVVPEKTTKITGKIGSDLRRKQYKEKGWAMDNTTSKPKAKSSGAVAVKPSKKETIKPKLASKRESPKPKTDKQIRKNKSIDKKQGKADKARSEGNFKKAARKERAIEKKKARMKKRSGYQGQAASAINPN